MFALKYMDGKCCWLFHKYILLNHHGEVFSSARLHQGHKCN